MSEEKRPSQSRVQPDHGSFEPLPDEIVRCANQLDRAAESLSERFSKPTVFVESVQHLPPDPVIFDPQTIREHRDLLTFILNVPLGLFDTLIDRSFIEAPSLVSRLKEIYGEVITEARHLITQLDTTAPIDLASWFRFTGSNIPFAARRLRRMAALLQADLDLLDEPQEDTSKHGGHPSEAATDGEQNVRSRSDKTAAGQAGEGKSKRRARKKASPQLLEETRERRVVKELTKDPNITEDTRDGPRSTSLPIPQGPTDVSTQSMEWDVFISHASEDKEAFVRPLAAALQEKGLRVWLDELVLTVGDSLRRSIDDGLARSRYGVVVISPDFLKKEWPQKELDGLAAREVDGRTVILPVWHHVDRQTVLQYSPLLADRVASVTTNGLDGVVQDLMKAMRS